MNIEELYKRQIALPNISLEGQKKLLETKVLVIGAGALGSSSILYLVEAGIGKVGICDKDFVEVSNLPRQTLYTIDDIGKSKSKRAYEKASRINPFTEVVYYEQKIDESNINDIADKYEIIVDCSDNLKTKFLVHDYCYKHDKNLIQGSIYQYEGQVFVFPFGKYDKKEIPCYRCLWKEIPNRFDKNTSIKGVIGVIPGFIGIMEAFEAIKLVLDLNIEDSSIGYLWNSIDNQIRRIRWDKDEKCTLCGEG